VAEKRALSRRIARLQHPRRQRLCALQHRRFANRQQGGGTGEHGAYRIGSHAHRAPARPRLAAKPGCGPVTGINTSAARWIQSDKSSGDGSRAATGWVSRNTDEAPPRQLGRAGRVRCDAEDLSERWFVMAA